MLKVMNHCRRVLTLMGVSFISLGIHARESMDWIRRPEVDSASMGDWFSSGMFGSGVTVIVLVAGAVWAVFLLSAWRMVKEQPEGGNKAASGHKGRRFALPVSGAPRVGLDPYGTEGYHPRLKAARFSSDSSASPSRDA